MTEAREHCRRFITGFVTQSSQSNRERTSGFRSMCFNVLLRHFPTAWFLKFGLITFFENHSTAWNMVNRHDGIKIKQNIVWLLLDHFKWQQAKQFLSKTIQMFISLTNLTFPNSYVWTCWMSVLTILKNEFDIKKSPMETEEKTVLILFRLYL